jgi:hypothetical protein
MTRDDLMRRALWASVFFNLGGSLLFFFPASLGRLAILPVPVPPAYSALLAFFIVLFGGAYAWLALQPRFDRPLVAFSAIGKAGAFAVVLACWVAGAVEGRAVLAITGDLVFAAIFAWWLLGSAARD